MIDVRRAVEPSGVDGRPSNVNVLIPPEDRFTEDG
jgi:hypothetical protein